MSPSRVSRYMSGYRAYHRGVAYAAAADATGWRYADADADCPFAAGTDNATQWHLGLTHEAARLHEEAKRLARYEFPAWLSA